MDLKKFKHEVKILRKLSTISGTFLLRSFNKVFGFNTLYFREAFTFEESSNNGYNQATSSRNLWFEGLPPIWKEGVVLVTEAGLRSHLYVHPDHRGEKYYEELIIQSTRVHPQEKHFAYRHSASKYRFLPTVQSVANY